jgi:hypothetical protein
MLEAFQDAEELVSNSDPQEEDQNLKPFDLGTQIPKMVEFQ